MKHGMTGNERVDDVFESRRVDGDVGGRASFTLGNSSDQAMENVISCNKLTLILITNCHLLTT